MMPFIISFAKDKKLSMGLENLFLIELESLIQVLYLHGHREGSILQTFIGCEFLSGFPLSSPKCPRMERPSKK